MKTTGNTYHTTDTCLRGNYLPLCREGRYPRQINLPGIVAGDSHRCVGTATGRSYATVRIAHYCQLLLTWARGVPLTPSIAHKG